MRFGAQMQGAAMPAMAEVAQRLGVDADWIVFGDEHNTPIAPVNTPQPIRVVIVVKSLP